MRGSLGGGQVGGEGVMFVLNLGLDLLSCGLWPIPAEILSNLTLHRQVSRKWVANGTKQNAKHFASNGLQWP